MQAIILAGGKGRQINSLLANVPKPLLPLFDRPVAEYTIKLLAKHGIKDIIIVLSRSAKDIVTCFDDGASLGVNIRYAIEDEPLGTAGSVKALQPLLKDTFIVLYGDIVTDCDLAQALEYHKSKSAIATLLTCEVDDPSDFGLIGCDNDGRLTRIVEKPKSTQVFTNKINSGIYILEKDMLSCIPSNQVYDFSRDLFPRMLNNLEPVYAMPLPGYWCDIGNINHYRNVHFDALTRHLKLDLPAVHIGEGVWLGENVDIHSTVHISSPVYIGSGSIIKRNATLNERTVIGDNTIIEESASISRSIIGCESSIGANSKIVGSIIGSSYAVVNDEVLSDHTLISNAIYKPTVKPSKIIRTAPSKQTIVSEKQAAERLAA